MGECGCNEMEMIRGVYDVGKFVLAIEVYSGCRYCKTPIAFTLHMFTPEEARDFMLESSERFEPDEWGFAMKSFPLMDKKDLIAASKDLPNIVHYANLEDWLEDNGRELLSLALYKHMENKDE